MIYRFVFDLTEFLKSEKITSLHSLELGMHDTKDVSAIEQLMDSIIELTKKQKGDKVEQYILIKKKEEVSSGKSQKYMKFNISRSKGLVLNN